MTLRDNLLPKVDAIVAGGPMVGAQWIIGQQHSLCKSDGHNRISGVAPSSLVAHAWPELGTSDDIPISPFGSPGRSNQLLHPA